MFIETTSCRCCGSNRLTQYLNLGKQPLANNYHKGDVLPTFPLEVNLCEDCCHSQLSIVVDPKIMFEHYLYVSGTPHTFRNHCAEFAQDAKSYWGGKRPIVLDIACNDGTLLDHFRDGDNVFGVDPAKNLLPLTRAKNIPVVAAYWGDGSCVNNVPKADIITAANVFAHVHNVNGFLDDSLSVLAEGGIIILEFPYCDEMIYNCEFDTVYHEHLSYFLVNSLAKLVERKGLGISRIVRTPIHGGSIRFFLQRNEPHCAEVDGLIESERKRGLLQKDTYLKFRDKVNENKHKLTTLVGKLKAEGKKVIGYGASAKGNTMLNYFQLNLDYIVDDNPMKWGYLTPGRNIEIKSPETMADEDELHVVILAWNFLDEIVSKIEKITGKSHNYISYVPEVKCLFANYPSPK